MRIIEGRMYEPATPAELVTVLLDAFERARGQETCGSIHLGARAACPQALSAGDLVAEGWKLRWARSSGGKMVRYWAGPLSKPPETWYYRAPSWKRVRRWSPERLRAAFPPEA
ncbi:MAG TPA: hypothetical protein VIL08_02655 [Limnochorda sp.]